MNQEILQQPELNAARNRLFEIDKAAARISMAEAGLNESESLVPVVDANSVENNYSPAPTNVTSIEEHQARKTVEEVYRQQNSFPLPQDNNLAA